jgi:hypothetical protein
MSMASERDLNSSWDALEEDSHDAPLADSPMDSSPDDDTDLSPLPTPPSRRSKRISRNSTPTAPHSASSRRRTPNRSTPRFAVTPSIESSQSFVMPSPYSPPNTFNTRRRSTRLRTPVLDRESPQPRKVSRRISTPRTRERDGSEQSLKGIAGNVALSVINYLVNLTFQTLSWLNPFLAPLLAAGVAVLAVYIAVWWIFHQTVGHLPTSLSSFVPNITSPCSIPLISRLPVCGYSRSTTAKQSPEFNHLITVQDDFSKVLDLSEATALFPLEFTRTETPLLELRDVIKFQSQLPSKADLIMQFDHFVQLARESKADLSTFTTHIGGATDKIISMNRHTLRVLKALNEQKESQSAFAWAFGALTGRGNGISEHDVVKQYLHHADAVERQTDALIFEGEALLLTLSGLDQMLDSIRETANQDMAELISSQDELFSQLWTLLGGNARDRKRLKKNIAIADRLRETRNQAAQVVQLTVDELRRIKNGLVDLQARIMGPANRGVMNQMEIEEHVQYVQDGLDRLYLRRLEGTERVSKGVKEILGYANRVFKGDGTIDGRKFVLPQLDAH